jgi:hypothetical protein
VSRGTLLDLIPKTPHLKPDYRKTEVRVQRNREQPEEQRRGCGSPLFLWFFSVPLYLPDVVFSGVGMTT